MEKKVPSGIAPPMQDVEVDREARGNSKKEKGKRKLLEERRIKNKKRGTMTISTQTKKRKKNKQMCGLVVSGSTVRFIRLVGPHGVYTRAPRYLVIVHPIYSPNPAWILLQNILWCRCHNRSMRIRFWSAH